MTLKKAKAKKFDEKLGSEFSALLDHYRSVKGLPPDWRVKLSDDEAKEMIIELSGTSIKAHFQDLLDKTYIPIWTRDRKIHGDVALPQRLLCMDVQRVENEGNYLEYMEKRTQ